MNLLPGYLWIGSHKNLTDEAVTFLQSIYCLNQGCGTCAECVKITSKQHHLVRWFEPENQYTTAILEPLFETISFSLDADQHFFFVLTKADLLSPTCANSLLKSLEEPPAGYHFLLLAQRAEGILPTIRSRCVVKDFQLCMDPEFESLLQFFKAQQKSQQAETDFIKEVEKLKLNDSECALLLDHIHAYWSNELQEAITQHDAQAIAKAQRVIAVIGQSRNFLPMSGSSKLFLKNLYLQLQLVH